MTTQNLFSNRATAKIAVDVASNDSAITLVAGGGALFPPPGAGQYFRLVLQKGSAPTDQREYMICTNVTGDVLTVTRAQEGTPAAEFTVGDEASLVITAASAAEFVQRQGVTLQGALEVEADPTTPLGIATKAFVENGRLTDAPADGKDYARKDNAWDALGAAAKLAVPIPITAGGTGGVTLLAAQTNLVIGLTSIDDLAPATPKYGDRWIKPSNMTELVWVPNQGGGGTGVWINPMDAQSEAYPIVVAKGGTGATTAPQALVNLGGTTVGTGVFTAVDAAAARAVLGIPGVVAAYLPLTGANPMTGALKLADGTVAAPGLAFNSEPGLGLYRFGAGVVAMAASGARTFSFNAASAALSRISMSPVAAAGGSSLFLQNQPSGAANYNFLEVRQEGGGVGVISTYAVGTATRGNLTLDAPVVATTGNLLAANTGYFGFSGSSSNLSRTSLVFSDYNTGGSTRYNVIANADLGGAPVQFIGNHNPSVRVWGEIRINNSASFQFDLDGNAYKGVAGPWSAISDVRVKESIEDYSAGLDAVLKLRPRSFTFKAGSGMDTSVRYVSMIAQEALQAMPDTVTVAPGKCGEIELEDMHTFDPTNITYALVNAVKTIHQRLSQLEQK